MKLLFTSVLGIALVCILANQINNLAYVLAVGSPDYSTVYGLDWRILAAVSWSVGIELGVLVSVLSGKRKQAAVLAVMSCTVNLAANQVWIHPLHIFVAKTTVYAISAYLLWFFSELVGTYYVSNFSNLFTNLQAPNLPANSVNEVVNAQSTSKQECLHSVYNSEYGNSLKNVSKVRKQKLSDVTNVSGVTDDINVDTQESMFTCPYCDWKGSSRQARYNHINRNHQRVNHEL